MFNWLRELLEIKYEYREKKLHCISCDTLKEQLTHANYEKEMLLKRIMEKPEAPVIEQKKEMTPPRMIPWNVRRQMLEREDREKARLMREAPKPDSTQSVEDLEKELDIASAEREAEASQPGGTKPAIG